MFKNHFKKFGQLIVRKVIEIAATGCHILCLKCSEIDFGWGSSPYPTTPLGNLQRSPRPSSGNKWDLRLTEGEGCREREGKAGERTPCASLVTFFRISYTQSHYPFLRYTYYLTYYDVATLYHFFTCCMFIIAGQKHSGRILYFLRKNKKTRTV